MDEDPEQARTALSAIKQSSRELLHEMRATLGVLRGVDERPPHQPVPGLARLDALISGTRAAEQPAPVVVDCGQAGVRGQPGDERNSAVGRGRGGRST